MLNLLIVENNLIESHFLINSICKELPDIRLYGIAHTGMEAINIIKENEVDIIILDFKLPDVKGIDIINYISKNNITKYNSSIIVMIEDMDIIPQIVGNKYIFSYYSKTSNIKYIIDKIIEISKQKKLKHQDSTVMEQIKSELELLNFNFSYNGTKYLYECIYECYCKDVQYDINLNREIYPVISKKYRKSIDSIKANIFKSTSIMYNEIKEHVLYEYFGYKFINKPKTKEIIMTILKKLQ